MSKVRFRVGTKVPTNIYDGDRPMGHACRPEDAQLIVNALNLMEESFGAGPAVQEPTDG